MDCPLCGAENDAFLEKCVICDSLLGEKAKLQHASIQKDIEIEGWLGRVYWRRLLSCFALLLLVVVPYLFFFDLFQTPEEIIRSRQNFIKFQESYRKERDRWDFQKEQILSAMREHRLKEDLGKDKLSFSAIPLEILFAFLEDDLGFSLPKFDGVCLYPLDDLTNPVMILSKYENVLWPLQVMLSMEIELKTGENRIEAKIRRLRRGAREISPSQSWEYFGAELQALRVLEMFSGGVSVTKFYREENSKEVGKSLPILLSWKYLHHGIALLKD